MSVLARRHVFLRHALYPQRDHTRSRPEIHPRLAAAKPRRRTLRVPRPSGLSARSCATPADARRRTSTGARLAVRTAGYSKVEVPFKVGPVALASQRVDEASGCGDNTSRLRPASWANLFLLAGTVAAISFAALWAAVFT